VLGVDPAALVDTVTRWNRCCDAKRDTEFGRKLMLELIAEKPFYAVELSPSDAEHAGRPEAERERTRSYGPAERRSRGSAAQVNWARSTAICTREPAISANAWLSVAFPGGMRRPETPWS